MEIQKNQLMHDLFNVLFSDFIIEGRAALCHYQRNLKNNQTENNSGRCGYA